MKTIVFVCTGNTCRSPMAEGMFRALLQQHGISDVEVTSCGTGAFPGMPASKNAVVAAAEYGVDISAHCSRPLSDDLLAQGDLFVCMVESQREILLFKGVPSEKLRVLGAGISDPFGGDPERYRICAKQIQNGLQSLIKEFL